MKHIQLFEQFINEATVTIEATHDFMNSGQKGEFEINGKSGKYKGETDSSFVNALAKEMGVAASELEEWFYDKYDFNILRASELDLSGTKGKLDSFDGDAWEMD